jgi:hypothetical protein
MHLILLEASQSKQDGTQLVGIKATAGSQPVVLCVQIPV